MPALPQGEPLSLRPLAADTWRTLRAHPLTSTALGAAALLSMASMVFGIGVLVTPWGHGSWGVVPSREDVLFAEFAQKKHMLKFEKSADAFVSTRCDDGEVVRGGPAGGAGGSKKK